MSYPTKGNKGNDALPIIESDTVKSAHVYILEGSDDYLLSGVLQVIRRNVVDQDFLDFNHTVLECSASTKASELINALLELPMLTNTRLLELHNYHKISSDVVKKIEKTFKDTIEQGSNIVCLTALDEAKSVRSRLKTLAQGQSLEINCSIESGQIMGWISYYLKSKQCTIQNTALREIANRGGSSLANLSMQLDKLIMYVGESHNITLDDVKKVVIKSTETKVWDYTTAITDRDDQKALLACSAILEDNPQAGALSLLSYTNSYLRSLAQVSDLVSKYGNNISAIIQQLNKREFQIKRDLKAASTWGEDALRKAFGELCKADLRLKTGSDPVLIMHLLTLSFTHRPLPPPPSKNRSALPHMSANSRLK
ncbi:MAG: DNA polymerase III subunit delta [bacterium]|nr:DNA polymerase III subunit delta [bacterium]